MQEEYDRQYNKCFNLTGDTESHEDGGIFADSGPDGGRRAALPSSSGSTQQAERIHLNNESTGRSGNQRAFLSPFFPNITCTSNSATSSRSAMPSLFAPANLWALATVQGLGEIFYTSGGGCSPRFVASSSAKSIADQISVLRTDVQKLQKVQKDDSGLLERVANQVEALHATFDDAVEHATGLEEHIMQLTARFSSLESFTDKLQEDFITYVESCSDVTQISDHIADRDDSEPVNKKKMTNNSLQMTCLRELMGIGKKQFLPAPLLNEHFWTVDDPMAPDCLLHPNWSNWSSNETNWLREVTQKIKNNGHNYSSALNQEELTQISLSDIENAIEASFKTMQDKYKGQQKLKETQVDTALKMRCKARKSTDESDKETGGIINADSDNDECDEIPKTTARQCPWRSREPLYRDLTINPLLARIDKHIFKEWENAAGVGNTHRGEPKDVSLPTICKNKKQPVIKIPCTMVDADW
ncbi:hypothetical protein BKA93DRAFT_753798 [Sparassis latifolia]